MAECGRIRTLQWEEQNMGRMDIDMLRRTPAYSYVEAAHYLNLPPSTLSSWFRGVRPILMMMKFGGSDRWFRWTESRARASHFLTWLKLTYLQRFGANIASRSRK